MENTNLSSPIAFSGGGSSATAAADDSFLVLDPNSQIGSASGSLQNDGVLSGGAGDAGSGSSSDAEFGFQRAGFGQDQIAGTVSILERHVFLCYKTPQVWPSHLEAPEFDRLPRLLAAALMTRKPDIKRKISFLKHFLCSHTPVSLQCLGMAMCVNRHFSGSSRCTNFGFHKPGFNKQPLAGTVHAFDRHVFLSYGMPKTWPSHIEIMEIDRLPSLLSAALTMKKSHMRSRTRLTICEGEDSTESSNGDVLIFPDMIRYRRLTHFDVDNFVEEALVKETEWLPGVAETLSGSYIFVCCHGSRDRRCGVCGPPIVKKFKEEINSRGLQGQVFVSPCSHVGGHKYAGNVILFSPNIDRKVNGHWYGYVTPDDVPVLLEQHICKGQIVEQLWRGQMGLSEEEQKNAHDLRLKLNRKTEEETIKSIQTRESDVNRSTSRGEGCCQGVGKSSCCQNLVPGEKEQTDGPIGHLVQKTEDKSIVKEKKACTRKPCALPTWFESWEREDTYAALAVAAALVSVGIAYGCYKQLK